LSSYQKKVALRKTIDFLIRDQRARKLVLNKKDATKLPRRSKKKREKVLVSEETRWSPRPDPQNANLTRTAAVKDTSINNYKTKS